jgi:uncharacterized protein
MAKRKGIAGWHSMRKDELIKVLAKLAKAANAKAARNGCSGRSTLGKSSSAAEANGDGDERAAALAKHRASRIEHRLRQIKDKLAASKDLAFATAAHANGSGKDRLVVMVRGPYWLQVYWELTRPTIERAEAAMGQHWHGARPVLRLFEVTRDGTTNSVRKHLRDIDVHGGVNHWYVDVPEPPKSFQFDIGYLALSGRFLGLAKSNVVTTPRTGTPEASNGHWDEGREDFDHIYAMSGGYANNGDNSDLKELFEERLHRPMSPLATRFGVGAGGMAARRSDFHLDVDAELIVYGVTNVGSHVTLTAEPIRLAEAGTFMLRFDLPDRRRVLPVVASSADGAEQRTIVLAVERNTKVMEPVLRDPDSNSHD